MFEKICAGITASSTFIIAGLCVWWTANIVKCGRDVDRVLTSSSGLEVTSEEEMQAESEDVARQLQERFVKSQQQVQDAAASLVPGDHALPAVPDVPMVPLPSPRTARERAQSWDPSKGLPPGIAPKR